MKELYHLLKPVNVYSLYYCFSPSFQPNYYFGGERHDFWECVYVVDGKVGISEDEKVYELGKDEIIFHKPMEFHRIWSANGTSPKLIITSFTAGGFGMDILAEGVFKLDNISSSLMLRAANIAQNDIIHDDNWKKNYIAQQLFSNTLENMMLHIIRDAKSSIKESDTISAKNYKNIINAMNENINSSLSIEQLARLTNLSTANLKKCFNKYAGMGVIAYFNRLKMIKAENLIREGYSMSEISDMLGYSCQNYFSSAFKKEHGVSPLEFKKNLK